MSSKMNLKKTMICFSMLGCISQLQAYSIYVSNEKDNTISVIDGASFELVETIEVGQRPRGITLSDDNKKLFVCTSDDNHVEVLDLDTGKVVDVLPSGPDP